MNKETLHKLKLPDAPGVYFWLGAKKEILYVGKATSLKNRVRSYFADDLRVKRSQLIEQMVAEAKTVEVTQTDSVLEALILETNLIRTHKPKYNTRSKDDKSYNYLIITNEEWPRVLVVRGKDLALDYTKKDILYSFGPFPNGLLFKEALRIVRKIFQFYDTKQPVGTERSAVTRGVIDFNRQLGLYPDKNDHRAYQQTIRHIRLFFSGKKRQVIRELEKEMHQRAKAEEFEVAQQIKRKLFALEHIQDVALMKKEFEAFEDERSIRIEAYDIAHLAGQEMVGVMTVVHGETPATSEYRQFKIRTLTGANDTAALGEVLSRRLEHREWPLPTLIVADGAQAQKNALERVLRKYKLTIPVVAVVKDERHKPIRLIGQEKILQQHKNGVLLANAESHRFAIAFHRKLRRKKQLS